MQTVVSWVRVEADYVTFNILHGEGLLNCGREPHAHRMVKEHKPGRFCARLDYIGNKLKKSVKK